MPEIAPTVSTLIVKINETAASSDVMDMFVSAAVETSTNLPGRFSITFRDEYSTVVATLGAAVGDQVKLEVRTNEATAKPVFTGEITALETDFSYEGTRTMVRGYERSHRLQGGRKIRTFVNTTYSDLVRRLINEHGIRPGTIFADTEVRDWVAQNNVSDWDLLQTMADELGCQMSSTDGKLNFDRPANPSTSTPFELIRGENLLRARVALSASQQVSSVTVNTWDDGQKQALMGKKTAASSSPAGSSWSPRTTASKFGSPELYEVSTALGKQSVAEDLADSVAALVGDTVAELEGLAFGHPSLHAGVAVKIKGFQEPFDGTYLLSGVRHEFDWDGYRTAFTAAGRQDRSLLGLAGRGGDKHGFQAYSLVSAIVTDNNDEKSLNRVKVKIPALADDFVTDWAPVVQAGAGNNRGSVFLPEVNDQVLVAFQQNDIRRPVVVGGMHNGKDRPKIKGAELVQGGAVVQRAIVSRAGHTLALSDDESKQQVSITTSDSNHKIVLDQTGTEITVTSQGKVTISGAQDVTVKSDTNLNLQGTQVKITAQGPLQLQGATVKIASEGPLEASGAIIKLN